MKSLLKEQAQVRNHLIAQELFTNRCVRELEGIRNLLNSNGQMIEPLSHNAHGRNYKATGVRHNDSHRRSRV